MKSHKSNTLHHVTRPRPRKKFYVDLNMCGGEMFLEDFDLAEFCEILQALVPQVEVVAVTDPGKMARNAHKTLVSEDTFTKAIVRYVGRCALGACDLP